MHLLHLLVRVICGVFGAGFGYMALFMYRDTQGRVQNRLVDFWVRANTTYEEKLSRESMIIKTAAETAESGMRWLFGEKSLSLRLVLFSVSASVASVLFVFSFANPGWSILPSVLVGVTHILYGLYAVRVLVPRGRIVGAILLFVVLQFAWFSLLELFYGWQSPQMAVNDFEDIVVMIEAGIPAGLFCDVCFLVITRNLIKWIANAKGSKGVLVALGFSLSWMYLQMCAIHAVFLHFRGQPIGSPSYGFVAQGVYMFVQKLEEPYDFLIVAAFSSTLFNLLAASSIFIVLCVVLSHRIIWPVISRVVYAVYQWELCTNRALQLAASIALLSFASPWFEDVVKRFKH
jgi:hypothetical protein